MKFEIKNWNWEVVDSIELPDEVFGSQVRKDIVAQVVRWQRAKARSGNANTKTRSEVSGTTRKPWAQKETGKSRQGSLRSPHFRGGGVVFGPHTRSYEHKLNKKTKIHGAISMLSSKALSSSLHLVKDFEMPFERTKNFVTWKEERKFKSILFVIGNEVEKSEFSKSFSNVPYCDFIPARGFNVLDCIKHEEIILDVSSANQLVDRYMLTSPILEEESL